MNNENENNGNFSSAENQNGEGMFTGNTQENETYTYNNQGYQYPQQGGYERELEEPMTLGEWVVTLLLLTFVPCVNIILLFIWAFSDKEKKSKSNFCKATLIIMGISIGLYLIAMIAIVGLAAASAF